VLYKESACLALSAILSPPWYAGFVLISASISASVSAREATSVLSLSVWDGENSDPSGKSLNMSDAFFIV